MIWPGAAETTGQGGAGLYISTLSRNLGYGIVSQNFGLPEKFRQIDKLDIFPVWIYGEIFGKLCLIVQDA